MTLRLHRNPPITARSTSTATDGTAADWAGKYCRSLLLPGSSSLSTTWLSLAVVITIGLATSGWLTTASAEESFVTTADYLVDPQSSDSGVVAVGYSAAKSGQKLKWLPYRPSQTADGPSQTADGPNQAEKRLSQPRLIVHEKATKERLVQYSAPVAPMPLPNGVTDPFDDPFGDRQVSRLPRTAFQDDELEALNPQQPGDSLPPITAADVTADIEIGEGTQSELDQTLAAAPQEATLGCEAVKLKSISQITNDISAKGDKFPGECQMVEGVPPDTITRGWEPLTFTWKASALCHKQSFFEDTHLERYGHSWGPYLQPVMSGAHFFLNVPIIPYKMGLYPPNECIYTLGYYRPGNCAPYMLDPLPLSIRAGLAEAGVVTGLAFLIP